MGALAPISPWIPEDDLLLKNAVEAGASLESLAKGAVQFSRKFSVWELQDRWHSLLYDPDVSSEASARMVEFELSASNLSLKSNRSGNYKELEVVPGKRKVDSIRRHYYAMRKRICNSFDLSFLVSPGVHNCSGNGRSCQEQLTIHNNPSDGNFLLEDPISNHFGLQESDFNTVHHAFQQIGGSAGVPICGTDHAFASACPDSLGDDLPDEIMGRDCFYSFAENISPVCIKEPMGNGIGHSFEQSNVQKDTPHSLGESISVFENCSGVEEMRSSQVGSARNLFGPDNLEKKPLCTFDSVNNTQGTICSEFGRNQGFSSPVSDCGASFHSMDYSSPLPRMAIWRSIEDTSAPDIQTNVDLGDGVQRTGDRLLLPDDNVGAKKLCSSGYDMVQSEPKLKDRMTDDGLNNSDPASEGDFADLSDSLLNLTNEVEILLMGVDGKDMTDRSCLDDINSLLLGSPADDSHQDNIPCIAEPKTSVASETYLVIHGDACPEDIVEPVSSDHNNAHVACHSKGNISLPTSTQTADFPEISEGVICCTLNTEDQEIPCNDHIILSCQALPSSASSVNQPNFKEGGNPAFSVKDTTGNQMPIEQGQCLMRKVENASESLAVSRMIGSQVLLKASPDHQGGVSVIKSELPEIDYHAEALTNPATSLGGPNHCGSAPTPKPLVVGVLKEEITNAELRKQCNFENPIVSFLEKPVHGSDHHPLSSAGGYQQDIDASAETKNHQLLHAEPGSLDMAFLEPVVKPSTSDEEEESPESDDDVPYFSDIEAMILDMDLGPENQDRYLNREVSRYQDENSKRAIIRLEQGAHSYMQRAIASHGAFALLYGRHLKHYIKKHEVLLGRATDDVNVDVNLGIEGRANKISRRQAIIKMDDDGSFYLKNLGKCSILVNNKEVASGQCLSLPSSCLLEIRGMRFIFEMNQNAVRNYVANMAKRKHEDESSKFHWSSEGVY